MPTYTKSRSSLLTGFLILIMLITGCAGQADPAPSIAAEKSQDKTTYNAVDSPAGKESKGNPNSDSSAVDSSDNAASSGEPVPSPSTAGKETKTPAAPTSPETAGKPATGKAAELSGGDKDPSIKKTDSGPSSSQADESTGKSGVPKESQDNPASGTEKNSPAASKPAGDPAATTGTKPVPGAAQPSVPENSENKAAQAQDSAAAEAKTENTVTLSIIADPDTGTVLAPTPIEIGKGDTVLDILKRITRNNKIQMEFSGRGAAAYVEGINNVYEFDHGSESGWMYRVDGEFPNKSAGAYKVKAGDTVEWLYTLDLGKDLGGDIE
ncbi:DUF4430 domain-containing protein [Paenibacillus nasutitermitis]|uniref:Transcobalamin-like C-terminal domain-containing protein n=1 Tax=Paenibacillus nasutitermitis TaxID=1652958 RepID=A0A916YS66_9BACL|nr:DUF4430 domain-containing protein [Paenibacillus nasutitermitis]GGD57535.1 hypothetical protein GCM10010911_14180 [Paenibacillus nasutitermitis]